MQNERLLMKTVGSTFSTGQLRKVAVLNTESFEHMYKTCKKKFESKHAVDSHKCCKKWICQTCDANITNEYNYQKHIEKDCKLYTCQK